MITIFQKKYDGESLYDLLRDINEAFEEKFNPAMEAIPKDQYDLHQGTFTVKIEWKPDED